MEVKINLLDLTPDQIMRKIKAFKSDINLIGLTLYVKRKDITKSAKIIKSKNCEPTHIQALIQKRKENKTAKQAQPQPTLSRAKTLFNQKTLNQKGEQLNQQNKDKFNNLNAVQNLDGNQQEDFDSYDFVSDSRVTKARKNYAQGNYDTAINIFTELMDQVQLGLDKNANQSQSDKQRKVANISFHLANCYFRKKNYQKAIQLYSIQLAQENYKHKAMRKSNLGAIYLHLNKNQQSLRNYTQALKIYSQCNCQDMDLSNTYHNVGNIYLRQKMYEIASKYFQKSIQERKLKSPEAQLPLYYTAYKLGVSQKNEQRYQQSLKSQFYALSLAERGVGELIQVYKQIAHLYELVGKPNDALNYYQKICDSGKATHNDQGFAYEKAALIYIKQKQESEGYRIMKTAEACYEKAGNERKVSFIRQACKTKSLQS